MASEELIDEYVNRSAIADDTKFLTDQLKTVLDLLDKVNATKVTLGGAKSMKDVADGAKEAQKATEELAKGKQKLIEVDLAAQKAAIAEKEAMRQRNAELKNQVREEQAAIGSIEQLRAQIIRLRKEYDNLGKAEREGTRGQDLLKNIQGIDTELKKLEGTTGRFQRRVGDYANAFSEALTPIQGQLQKIQAQIKNGGLGEQQMQKLAQQESLLLNVQKQLTQEFGSTRQQSRAFQEAVQQIGIEFGHQSDVFQHFKDQVGEGVDALNDIRDSIKLAASDTRQLDQLIGAATAIAGGFSIAQGAAALFGKENEDVQKALLKVQAVMSILNGLQAIQNELKNKDSLLRKLASFLIKEETKAIQGQAAASKVAASATNQTATATDNAAKATSRWGLALKTIGIGILLTLIPIVASGMSKLSKETTKVDEDLKGMGDTAEEIADNAIKGLDDEINKLNSSLGRTPSAVDKAKKALNVLAQEISNVFADDAYLDKSKSLIKEVISLWENDGMTRLETIQKKGAEIRKKIAEVEYLQRLQSAEEFLQAEFEAGRNAIKNRADLDKDAAERALNRLKKNFDERKIFEAQFLRDGEKLIKQSKESELQTIQANLDLELAQAAANRSKRKEAEDNAHTARVLAERNFQDKLTGLIEEAEKRRRKLVSSTIQGIVEITGSSLSKMAQALDTITGNSTLDKLLEWQRAFKEAKDNIVSQLKDLRKELGQTALSAFESFASFAFENQKNEIQEQIDKLDEKKQKEIEVVEQTITNEEDRTAAITAIERKSAEEKEKLEQQQRKVDAQKAKFEKAAAILRITIDTIQKVAAIKAQAAVLLANPLTAPLAPLALAQIPIVVATGAVSAAVVAAQPIPKFKKGRKGGPATFGITGDGGVTEVLASPDLKQSFATPDTDTLTYIPKDWKVFPDVDAFQDAAMAMSILPVQAMPVSEKNNDALFNAMAHEIRGLKAAIYNIPVTHMHFINGEWHKSIQNGNDWTHYVNRNF